MDRRGFLHVQIKNTTSQTKKTTTHFQIKTKRDDLILTMKNQHQFDDRYPNQFMRLHGLCPVETSAVRARPEQVEMSPAEPGPACACTTEVAARNTPRHRRTNLG